MSLHSDDDVVLVRLAVREWMIEQAYSLLKQTKMITATSELARNAITHGGGGGGEAHLERINKGEQDGIRVTVADQGLGIANLEQALQGGFSSDGGLGLGLSGSKKLVDEFDICSELGKGTRVTITLWK